MASWPRPRYRYTRITFSRGVLHPATSNAVASCFCRATANARANMDELLGQHLPRDIIEHVLYRYLEHPTSHIIKGWAYTLTSLWSFVLKNRQRLHCPIGTHTKSQHRALPALPLYGDAVFSTYHRIKVRPCAVCGLDGAYVLMSNNHKVVAMGSLSGPAEKVVRFGHVWRDPAE